MATCKGKTAAGEKCERRVKGTAFCFQHTEQSEGRCEGTTKAGRQCAKRVKGEKKYCYLHEVQVVQVEVESEAMKECRKKMEEATAEMKKSTGFLTGILKRMGIVKGQVKEAPKGKIKEVKAKRKRSKVKKAKLPTLEAGGQLVEVKESTEFETYIDEETKKKMMGQMVYVSPNKKVYWKEGKGQLVCV